MASKRMFSELVIESENFLELSPNAQALYMHLCMKADDDGFLNNLSSLQKFYGAKEEHINELENSGYIIKFDSSNCVIRHWKQSNCIPEKQYVPSMNPNKE